MNRSVAAVALRASLCALVLCSIHDAAFAQTIPSWWTANDIGASFVSGTVSYDGAFTVNAAGTDIWDTSDGFHFVYQPMTGDTEIVARVLSLSDTHPWAKAGVMVRESLAAESRHAMVAVTAGNGYAFLTRSEPAAYSEHTYGGEGAALAWVRLVRTGDLFESYGSSDGSSWTRTGSATIAMSATVYVGLAVASHNELWATTAVIDSVTVRGGTEAGGNAPPSVRVISPTSGATFSAPATISATADAFDADGIARVEFFAGSTHIATEFFAPYQLEWLDVPAGTYTLTAVAYDGVGASASSAPVTITVTAGTTGVPEGGDNSSGSQNTDIGWSTTIPGQTFYSAGTFTIRATGTDIWDRSDGFHFVYLPMNGDTEIVARVLSLTNTDSWAKAGVMVRESLSPESRHALVALTAGNGYAFQTRSEAGGYSEYAYGDEGSAPGWVRLVRRGAMFEGFRSSDGNTWTRIGSATIGMGFTVYVGLAVTSRNEVSATTAVIDSVFMGGATGAGGDGADLTIAPRAVAFRASADHEVSVSSYLLEIFDSHADPNSDMPVAASDLGRPTPDGENDITVDRATLFMDLAPGTYIATVSALGAEGRSRSAAVTFVR